MDMGSRQGESFSHFLSLELDNSSNEYQQFERKVKNLQENLGDVQGIGKAAKMESLHITLAVVHVTEEEVPSVVEKVKQTWEKYPDMLGFPTSPDAIKGKE